jgi:hypothetical protein
VKTVSLADALRSGKDFRYRLTPDQAWMKGYKNCNWTVEAILHAECQIIEEPREFWIWNYNNGNYSLIVYATKDDCIKDRKALGDYSDEYRPVKFREVID